MKADLYLSAIVIGMIALSSCKKAELDSASSKLGPQSLLSSKKDTSADVYVAGFVNSTSIPLTVAAYWKNGILHKLCDSSVDSRATSIAVQDSDVLIATTNVHNNDFVAGYYRNGNRVVLADKAFTGLSHCAVFSGSDFYICGAMMVNGNYKAVYWKNGIAHFLPDKSPQSYAYGITVNGSDVYVAGAAITTVNHKYAVYWKNDTAYNLTDTVSQSEARDIALVKNDVYIVGDSPSAGTYWKNGKPILLSDAAGLMSITTSGNDYYFSGNRSTGGQGIYWIKDKAYYLPSNGYETSADGIAVLNNDVYVAGWTIGDLSKVTPVYWKNGNIVQLPTPTPGTALSIAVVPR